MPGVELHRDKLRVVIATTDSENSKTGDMIQVWTLPLSESPASAVRSGADAAVCGGCKWRPTNVAATFAEISENRRAGCYVDAGKAPTSIWHAWQRGSYPVLPESEIPAFVAGRAVRLGAYGDPAFIPARIVRRLTENAAGWTGYTHQWRYPVAAHLHGICMASCDTAAEQAEARSAGWGTFRIMPTGADAPTDAGQLCPSGSGIHCAECLACNGAEGVDIWIHAHGTGSRNVSRLIQQIESAPAVKRQGA